MLRGLLTPDRGRSPDPVAAPDPVVADTADADAPVPVDDPSPIDTTRRYPRSLEDAFPSSEGYQVSTSGPYNRRRSAWWDRISWVIVIGILSWMAWQAWAHIPVVQGIVR